MAVLLVAGVHKRSVIHCAMAYSLVGEDSVPRDPVVRLSLNVIEPTARPRRMRAKKKKKRPRAN